MFNSFANRAAPPQHGRSFDDAVAAHRARAAAAAPARRAAASSVGGAPSSLAPSYASGSRAAPPPVYSGVGSASVLSGASAATDESRFEKQATLLEIDRLRQGGAATTRKWGMEDDIDDMRIEERKLKTNIQETQMVVMMRDFLCLGFTGIEFLNARVRLLDLEGWADAAGGDIERYDGTLRALYRKYGRRATASPEVELLMGIGASLIMHHAQRRVRGARGAAAARPAAAPARADNVPFSMPPRAGRGAPGDDDDDDDEAPPPAVVDVRLS